MPDNSQWGTAKYQGNSAPNWFKDTAQGGGSGTYPANNVIYTRPNHPADASKLEATDRGWEKVVRYTDSAGQLRTKREVVVANRGLANTLAYAANTAAANNAGAGPVITGIRWEAGNNAIGVLSGAEGGDGILFAEAGGVGVVVTFSAPVILVNAGLGVTDYCRVNVSATTTEGDTWEGLQHYSIDCRAEAAGNGTNELVFSNTTALVAGDTLTLEDSITFVRLAGVADIVAATGYSGRNANTNAYVVGKGHVNVSSYGVGSQSLVGDFQYGNEGQTLAADCGARDATDE